jgi:hypothetical protein
MADGVPNLGSDGGSDGGGGGGGCDGGGCDGGGGDAGGGGEPGIITNKPNLRPSERPGCFGHIGRQ